LLKTFLYKDKQLIYLSMDRTSTGTQELYVFSVYKKVFPSKDLLFFQTCKIIYNIHVHCISLKYF